MDVSLVKPADLADAEVDAWRTLARAAPEYDSPFYAPTFTRAVAGCRDDVEVAVLREGEECVGFLPFQRMARRTARPVGWRINDFQGAVLAGHAEVDPGRLLRHCRLSEWRFDHLPVRQSWCSQAHINHAGSPYIDLEEGYETYLANKRADGSSRLKTVMRKARKLQREVGPLRFEFDCRDPAVFGRMLHWKFEQLRGMNTTNVLASPWVPKTLEILRESDDPQCRGVLSALRFGDSLVAAHFGIRSERVLHWWFTAYDPAFGRHSPGAVLLLKLIEHGAGAGLERIDLGKGMEPYKQSFLTGATELAEGAIARTAWRQTAHRVAYGLMRSARRTPWVYSAAQWVKRVRRRYSASYP